MDDAGKLLVIVLLVSIIVGAFVLLIDRTYRIPYIIASNSTYYPGETDEMIKKYAAKISSPSREKKTYKSFKKYKKKYSSYNKYKKKTYYKNYKRKNTGIKKFTGVININNATAAELQKLPGIDSAMARKIILFRKIKHGFSEKSDLLKVPGLTEDIYNNIKNNISVE